MIDHPIYAKLVSKLSKISTKEHVLQRHADVAAGRQRIKDPFGLLPGFGLDADMHIVPLHQGETHFLRCVGSHQDMVTRDRQFDMQYHFLHRIGNRRMTGFCGDVAESLDASSCKGSFEDGLVETKGLFGIAWKIEISADPGGGSRLCFAA